MLPYYTSKNLFLAELLGQNLHISKIFYLFLVLVNTYLIWLISKKLLNKKFAFLSVATILFSPWFYYLAVGHSFYFLLLFPTLLIILGLIEIFQTQSKTINLLLVTGSLLSIYSSALFIPLLLILFITLIYSKIISLNKLKLSLILIFILSLPLLFLISKNSIGFTNSLRQEAKIFVDPGLINSINRYRGAAEANNYKFFSRVSENKYLFYSEYIFLKYVSQLVPETYFTPKYKLLSYAFNPPIFAGFTIPMFYGLYLALKKPNLRKLLFVSTILVIPSVISKDMVSLNRLVLFSPVVFLVISYGLSNLYQKRNALVAKYFLILTSILVLFQIVVVLFDFKAHEQQRFESYFGKNYELSEP